MKLEGIRVLDLSQFLPGPHLTMMMADHGAEVIRVEPPTGEPTRAHRREPGRHDASGSATRTATSRASCST